MRDIVGFYKFNLFSEKYVQIVSQQLTSISYRGTDSTGIYPEDNLVLGHVRLSIIDFSDVFAQSAKSIRATDIFTTIYMGSLKYYCHSEKIKDDLSKSDLTIYLDKKSGGMLTYNVDLSGLLIKNERSML